jgi:hypothetical protein
MRNRLDPSARFHPKRTAKEAEELDRVVGRVLIPRQPAKVPGFEVVEVPLCGEANPLAGEDATVNHIPAVRRGRAIIPCPVSLRMTLSVCHGSGSP